MKYSVGDQVYIKPEVITPANVVMIEQYGGQIQTISWTDGYMYHIENDPLRFTWLERNFEPVDIKDFTGIEELL